jgi:precorrin-6A synthase
VELAVRVVPGITSIQALTAAHAIPLNPLAGPVMITTGRMLRAHGWPEGADTIVVMLDSGCAFEALEPQGITIWWGAYLGMTQEALERGSLAEAGPRIAARRVDLRARHGWIMDVYLMRREQVDGN